MYSHIHFGHVPYISYDLFSGFRICWDNTQINVNRRRQGTGGQNQILLWANSYAAKDTVNTTHLTNQETRHATEIPLELLIQTPQVIVIKEPNLLVYNWCHGLPYTKIVFILQDTSCLRDRLEVLVERIVVDNIPHFSHYYQDCRVDHIENQHTEESSKKTSVTE